MNCSRYLDLVQGERDSEAGQDSPQTPHPSGKGVEARQDASSSADTLTLANPLEWQLSITTDSSSTNKADPEIRDPPKAVIASAFPFLAGSNYAPGIRVPPCWSFSIGFHPIFSISADSPYSDRIFSITYSLRQQDGSDLPRWMEWNVEYMTLSGVTPCDRGEEAVAVREEYSIRMIGSLPPPDDVITAAQSFTVIVASHSLEYLAPSVLPGALTLNLTTGGERIEQPLILGGFGGVTGVFFDGEPLTAESIGSIRVAADWAAVEQAAGPAPRLLVLSQAQSDGTYLPITLITTTGERLELPLNLHFQPSFFRYTETAGWLDDVILVIGKDFNVSLQQNTTAETETTISEQLMIEDVPDWMEVHLWPLGISGVVPESTANQTRIELLLRHTDPDSFAISKSRWNINLLSPASSISGETDPEVGNADHRGIQPRVLIPILVFASLVSLALSMVAVMCVRKKRRAQKEESRKWAEVLLMDRMDADKGNCPTPQGTLSKRQEQTSTGSRDHNVCRPTPAYSQDTRTASPSKLQSFMESAITPSKAARRFAQNLKDRSKRYTQSFISYPMDYLESTFHQLSAKERYTPPWSSAPIQPPPPPSSPTPFRPVSVAASIAPLKYVDPPVSGLPSTNFTSDTLLHGRRGSVSSVSWEDAPSPRGNQRIVTTTGNEDTSSDASLNRKMVVMNSDDENLFQSNNGRPSNLFFAELCQRRSSILFPPQAHFPSSVGSFIDSVRTESRLADAPEQ